jgi:hypothetical protein
MYMGCDSFANRGGYEHFDWILSVGGYRFEDERKQERYGIEASLLTAPYFGFVTSMDLEGAYYTNNIGIEVLGNFMVKEMTKDWKVWREGYNLYHQGIFNWPLVIPSFELGLSLNNAPELMPGIHTSVFWNLIILHPFVDYNVYSGRVDRKVGFKWKVGFGPFIASMMGQ